MEILDEIENPEEKAVTSTAKWLLWSFLTTLLWGALSAFFAFVIYTLDGSFRILSGSVIMFLYRNFHHLLMEAFLMFSVFSAAVFLSYQVFCKKGYNYSTDPLHRLLGPTWISIIELLALAVFGYFVLDMTFSSAWGQWEDFISLVVGALLMITSIAGIVGLAQKRQNRWLWLLIVPVVLLATGTTTWISLNF